MEWYYVNAGQRVGPISQEQLDQLVQTGVSSMDTLVWRAGMADWQPYSAVKGVKVEPGVSPEANLFFCSECGNSFSAENLIQIGSQRVCGNCKSILLQRIKEGAGLPGVLRYAGFGIRLVAKIADGFIAGVPLFALLIGLPQLNRMMQETSAALTLQLVLYLVFGAYSAFFVGTYGATPGKMVCRIKIVNADGSKVSYGKAVGRYFAELLNAFTLYIGYIIAAFDEEKRTLHDRICDTRVVKR